MLVVVVGASERGSERHGASTPVHPLHDVAFMAPPLLDNGLPKPQRENHILQFSAGLTLGSSIVYQAQDCGPLSHPEAASLSQPHGDVAGVACLRQRTIHPYSATERPCTTRS